MNNRKGFEIILKNEKLESYRKLALVFVLINLIIFFLFIFFKETRFAGMAGIIFLSVYYIYKRKDNIRLPLYRFIDPLFFYIIGITWLTQSILLGILFALTGLLLRLSLQPLLFVFTEENIAKKFFPPKKYEWSELDSVILKSGILTINFKDDRIIQAFVEEKSMPEEVDFNLFARTKIITGTQS